MGALGEALMRQQYLDPAAQGISSLIEAIQGNSNKKAFLQSIKEGGEEIRKLYAGNPEQDTTVENTSGPEGLLSLSRAGKNLGGSMPGTTGLEALRQASKGSQPNNDVVLGDIGAQLTGDFETANQKADQLEAGLMEQQIAKPVKQGDFEMGLGSLQKRRQSYQPVKKELKQFDPQKDLYQVDSKGNYSLIKAGRTVSKLKSIGSYVGTDNKEYVRLLDPETNEITEVPSENLVRKGSGTTVNVNMPKSEKWKDFGGYLNAILYKTDERTGKVENRPPGEQGVARSMVLNQAYSNLNPGALQWYQTEVKGKWGREDISQVDFLKEIRESVKSGTLDPEDAQDLIDFSAYRPMIFEGLSQDAKK